jgi:hypothetical protein
VAERGRRAVQGIAPDPKHLAVSDYADSGRHGNQLFLHLRPSRISSGKFISLVTDLSKQLSIEWVCRLKPGLNYFTKGPS